MEINWEAVAKSILQQEESIKHRIRPMSIGVLVTWKGNIYIGSIQEIAPEFSDEIILLSIPSMYLCEELVGTIRKLDKGRLEICADNYLDLYGRQHVLRRLGNRLTQMTSEQTKYMVENPPDIYEI